MRDGENEGKVQCAQHCKGQKTTKWNCAPCKTSNTEEEGHTSENAYYKRDAKKEKPMRLRELVKCSSPTDWLIAIFTFPLVLVAIYQYIILDGQLDVMRKDQRAWVSIGGNRNVTFTVDPMLTTHIPLTITNTGKTPAINVRADIYVEIVPNGAEPHFEATFPHTKWTIGAMFANTPKDITAVRYQALANDRIEPYPISAEEKTALDEGKA
jgi:hypothetical protein